MWKNRSPGVAGALCLGPFSSRNGCTPSGRGRPNSRSPTAAPTPATQVRSPSGIRKPTDRLSPLTSDSASRTDGSAPGSTVSVRKIAASVIGVGIAWGSVACIHASIAQEAANPIVPRARAEGRSDRLGCPPTEQEQPMSHAFTQVLQAPVVYADAFMLPMSVWEKVLRTLVVYAAIAVLVRLAGKRGLAQLNTFDLVVV